MKPIRILFFLFATTLMISCEPQEEANERENPQQPLKIPTSGTKRMETPEQARAKQEKKEETFKKECESTDIYLVRNMSLFPIHVEGSNTKVKGMDLSFSLYNASSLVTFENIELEVKFLSGSGSVVKKETFTFNEPLKPSKSAVHKVETPISQQNYNAFQSTEITLLGVDCVQ